MVQLVEKDAVLAEIDKKIYYFKDYKDRTVRNIACNILNGIKQSIDDLEVKEVDLEKELCTYLKMVEATDEDIDFVDFTKHFFELGLKAQKEE